MVLFLLMNLCLVCMSVVVVVMEVRLFYLVLCSVDGVVEVLGLCVVRVWVVRCVKWCFYLMCLFVCICVFRNMLCLVLECVFLKLSVMVFLMSLLCEVKLVGLV